ncbi:MAG TPA: hypothetical protein VGH19_02815 [Verrucomicrobiae bacterium]
MKFFFSAYRILASLVLAMLGCQSLEAAANDPSNPVITTWSRSQQFVISSHYKPSAPLAPRDDPRNNPNLTDVIRVSAAELAITSEKVKQALLLQLDASDKWKHRVRLNIRPEIPTQAGVYLYVHTVQVNENMPKNWLYELQIPEYVERRKLLRALAQVCLLEIGNRNNASSVSVNIPMWFQEGLIELVLAREGVTIVAEATPIQSRVNPQFSMLDYAPRDKVWKDPLSRVREKLKTTPPISFSDLSVPVDEQIASVGLEHFQSCSHLFVHELTSLPDGSGKLRDFLQQLVHFSHPQFAFLNAFHDHFKSPLDVEKWWSLAQVHFLSRNDNSRWPEKNALAKLNEILQPQVQIRIGADALPVHETYTVKRLIEEVDFSQQQPIIRQMIAQLQQLEWSLPPDMFKLVYDYHILLANYLHKREQLSSTAKDPKVASSTAKPVVKETLKQLNFLEVLREDFGSIGISTPVSTPSTNSADSPARVKDFLKSTP